MPVIFQRTVTLPDPDVFSLDASWSSTQARYPGIYAFFAGDECLYVGKSVNSIGSRIGCHMNPSISSVRLADGRIVQTGVDAQKLFHDRLAEAVVAGIATVHCFRCDTPDAVEGDVVACFKPSMQGAKKWERVAHGGASSNVQCIRVS